MSCLKGLADGASESGRGGQVPAGWNSSTTLPEGSSSKIWRPPGPVTMSLRKLTLGLAEPSYLGGDVGDDEVDLAGLL